MQVLGDEMRIISVWRFASEIIHLSAYADWQCAL